MVDYGTYLTLVGIILLLVLNLLTHRSVKKELNRIETDIKPLLLNVTADLQTLATIEKEVETLSDTTTNLRSRVIEDTAKLQTLGAKLKEATTPLSVAEEPLQHKSIPPAL